MSPPRSRLPLICGVFRDAFRGGQVARGLGRGSVPRSLPVFVADDSFPRGTVTALSNGGFVFGLLQFLSLDLGRLRFGFGLVLVLMAAGSTSTLGLTFQFEVLGA